MKIKNKIKKKMNRNARGTHGMLNTSAKFSTLMKISQ